MSTSRLDIPAHVLVRPSGEGLLILNLVNGQYFALNEVGAHIWQLVATGATSTQICLSVREKFDAPAEAIERDVTTLLKSLVEQRLVVVMAA